MNYGSIIKDIRRKLGMSQKEVSDENLSHNLLSNIETGKSKLTNTKALMLYKKFVEESYKKKITIDLEFDELLLDNSTYQVLKRADRVLKKLLSSVNIGSSISYLEVEEYVDFALQNEIGLMKYFILSYATKLLDDTHNDFKVDILIASIDYLKWQKFADVIDEFKDALKLLTPLAHRLEKHEQLIHYNEFYKEHLIDLDRIVEPDIYYNLALYYNIQDKLQKSTFYINLFENNSRELTLDDKLDILTIKALIATKTGNVVDGIKIYENICNSIEDSNFSEQKLLAISNLLFNVVHHRLNYDTELIRKYVDEAISLLPIVENKEKSIYNYYLNIALGLAFINDNEKSNYYINCAFDKATTDNDRSIVLCREYDHKFSIVNKEIFIENITAVEFKNLNEKNKVCFLSILLKLHVEATRLEINSECLFKLNKYVIEKI